MIPNVGTGNQAAREAWLGKTLNAIPAGSRILDAGAGELKYRNLCSHLQYVSQDFAKYDGRGDSKGLHMGSWDQSKLDIVSDITAIPEPDGSFDAVMCIEVFEHLPDPISAIREFHRLLRKEGHLILTAPFCSLTHFAPYHFYTGFNRYFYETHLPAHGFEIIDLQENGNFFEYLGQELRRVRFVAQRYADSSPRPWEQVMSFFLLRMLERFSRRDTGSSEILHFGCHVSARKR